MGESVEVFTPDTMQRIMQTVRFVEQNLLQSESETARGPFLDTVPIVNFTGLDPLPQYSVIHLKTIHSDGVKARAHVAERRGLWPLGITTAPIAAGGAGRAWTSGMHPVRVYDYAAALLAVASGTIEFDARPFAATAEPARGGPLRWMSGRSGDATTTPGGTVEEGTAWMWLEQLGASTATDEIIIWNPWAFGNLPQYGIVHLRFGTLLGTPFATIPESGGDWPLAIVTADIHAGAFGTAWISGYHLGLVYNRTEAQAAAWAGQPFLAPRPNTWYLESNSAGPLRYLDYGGGVTHSTTQGQVADLGPVLVFLTQKPAPLWVDHDGNEARPLRIHVDPGCLSLFDYSGVTGKLGDYLLGCAGVTTPAPPPETTHGFEPSTSPATTTPVPTTQPKTTTQEETTTKEATTPAETTPAETTPAETTAAETTQPATTTPGAAETTPAETTPAETTPPATTPAATTTTTTPAETTPAATTPAETTPAETTAGAPTCPSDCSACDTGLRITPNWAVCDSGTCSGTDLTYGRSGCEWVSNAESCSCGGAYDVWGLSAIGCTDGLWWLILQLREFGVPIGEGHYEKPASACPNGNYDRNDGASTCDVSGTWPAQVTVYTDP